MNRPPYRLLSVVLVGIVALQATNSPAQDPVQLDQLSLSQLEKRLVGIDNRLRQLAQYSLRGGIGAIGYRSEASSTAEEPLWVEIELGREFSIDEVVLVPNIWRDMSTGFKSDGFPLQFQVLAGTDSDQEGKTIARYDSSGTSSSRIGPLVIPTSGTMASWIRVEVTRQSTRAFDGRYVFQLAELLVFSDSENVALRQNVKASSNSRDLAGAWDKRFLVDGHMPYLMNSSSGTPSTSYISAFGEQPALQIDLGEELEINRIYLHAVDQSDTIPQAHAGDLGIPRHLKVESASRADFADANVIVEHKRQNLHSTGPIMMWRFPAIASRYVRLSAVSDEFNAEARSRKSRIGFAEIELFSSQGNVAFGKRAYTESGGNSQYRSLAALTDGSNLYGRILPIREWVGELALRHDLELERPLIATELSHRYARQKLNLKWMTWLAVLLTAAIGCIVWIDRIVRRRQIAEIRERIAADLHDELGADLHVIGLLGELAQFAVDSPDRLGDVHQRIRVMSQRAITAVRQSTKMIQDSTLLHADLAQDMKRCTQRIMADLDGGLTLDGEEHLQTMKPQSRSDLFLFYKESLVNISRHSGATKFSAHLKATPESLCLRVVDNGRGISSLEANGIPASLQRRAHLLRAKVVADHPADGGTGITLSLSTRR